MRLTNVALGLIVGAMGCGDPEVGAQGVAGSEPVLGVHDAVRVAIETSAGTIVVAIDVESAPRTAGNFLRYVDEGFYTGGSFYRSVRVDNQAAGEVHIEVIQGGINRARRGEAFDPIDLEGTAETGLSHVDGTLSMARAGPDTARGEFFICIGPQPDLDEGGARNPDGRGFAAFGRVVEGMEVVRRIHAASTEGQQLVDPVNIEAARRRGSS